VRADAQMRIPTRIGFEMTLQYPHRALVAPRVRVTVEYLLEAFANREELQVPLAALRAYEA